MRLTFLATCLFGFVVFVCPKSIDRTGQVRLNPPHISIINGIQAQAGDFPFMASLLFPLNATVARLCGGTLIASSYILTAAHCVDGLPTTTGNGYVFINTLNLTGGTGSTNRRVSSYIAHQQFSMNTTHVLNDVALLVLDQPVLAAVNIPFVQLPIDAALTTTTTIMPTTNPSTTIKSPPTTNPASTTTTTTKSATTTTTLKPTTTTPKPTTTTTLKPTTTTPKPTTTTTLKPTTTTPKPTTTTTLKSTTTTLKPTSTTPKPTTTTTLKPTTPTTKTTTTLKPSTTAKVITTTKPVVTSTIKAITTTTKKLAAHLRAFSTYSNQSAIITGWGVTSSGSTSWTLQKANVTVYDNTVCNQEWGNQFNGSTQVCAAQVNTATCFGDSGGPLLVNGSIQIGIVSFGSGNGCADSAHVPVFTRVSAYLVWIAATMASNPPPASGK